MAVKAYYELYITYPDGHTEEIAERYPSVEAACEFGNRMIVQVNATERYHKDRDDVYSFTNRKKGKPFFIVKKVEPKFSDIVYDSREA